MKRIYLSGPMTGLPEFNFPAFNDEAARLRAMGYHVVNPAEINPANDKTWEQCLREDLREMLTCDVLALLPNWHGSKGAHLEVQVAHRIGMQICDSAAIA